MQSVPAPLGLARGPVLALVAGVLGAGALALGIVTAGDAPAPPPKPAAHAYDGLIGGVPLQQARCVQWNAGTAGERDRVAGALAYSVGGATPYGRGTTLTSTEAHGLFDRACSSSIAQNWLLYELYIRAAGFRSYAPR